MIGCSIVIINRNKSSSITPKPPGPPSPPGPKPNSTTNYKISIRFIYFKIMKMQCKTIYKQFIQLLSKYNNQHWKTLDFFYGMNCSDTIYDNGIAFYIPSSDQTKNNILFSVVNKAFTANIAKPWYIVKKGSQINKKL